MLAVIKIIEENIPEVQHNICLAWLPKGVSIFPKRLAGIYTAF